MARKAYARIGIFPPGMREQNPGASPPIILRVEGRSMKQAVANAKRTIKRHLKNIEQGFYRRGVFHPIRASSDYSPGRAGETRKKKAKRRKKR